MKTYILFLIAICIFSLGSAQIQIKKSSIDSGGDSVNNGSLSIIYSIGEVAVAETSNNNVSLSEGFIGPMFKQSVMQPCLETPNNLISWWAAEDNTNDLYGKNNGTPQGGVSYTESNEGLVNKAFLFDGVNDVVVVPDSNDLDLTGDMTLELWVRQTGFEIDQQTVICKGAGNVPNFVSAAFSMRFDWATTFFLFEDTSGAVIELGGPAFEDWQWHHYAYVRKGNQHILYADGFGFGWRSFTNLPASSAGFPLTIGAQFHDPASATNTYNNFFGGEVDEVGIYNRALTEAEIQSIFNAGSDGKCSLALSVEDHLLTENQIKIYPNPVNNTFTLDLSKSTYLAGGYLKLQIFDLSGRLVKQVDKIHAVKRNIDITNLNSGLYLYQLSGKGKDLATGKIIKK